MAVHLLTDFVACSLYQKRHSLFFDGDFDTFGVLNNDQFVTVVGGAYIYIL